MQDRTKLYIDGEWVASSGTGTPDGATHTPGRGLPKPAFFSASRAASRSPPLPINNSSNRPVQSDAGGP